MEAKGVTLLGDSFLSSPSLLSSTPVLPPSLPTPVWMSWFRAPVKCWPSGAAEGCGPGGVAWVLSAGPTPSNSAVCLTFMSFRLTHRPTQSCDSTPKGPGPNIWGTAPSTGQRRACLLSEVDPRDHLFPSFQKKRKGGGNDSYNMDGASTPSGS